MLFFIINTMLKSEKKKKKYENSSRGRVRDENVKKKDEKGEKYRLCCKNLPTQITL